MRVSFVLLVVLSAILVLETEGRWWRRAVRAVTRRCRFVNGRLVCTFGRKKRDAGDTDDFQFDCSSHAVNGGVPKEAFDDAFEDVDDNDDGALNATEYGQYKAIMNDIEDCVNGGGST